MTTSHVPRRGIYVTAALTTALLGFAAQPLVAPAITQETEAELSGAQKALEDTGKTYDEACRAYDELQAQIADINAQIAAIKDQLPPLQKRAGAAVRDMYKTNHNSASFMAVLMKSQSLDELIANKVYTDQIQQTSLSALTDLAQKQGDLEKKQVELAAASAQAKAEKDAAANALAQAKTLREQAQQKAETEQEAQQAAREGGFTGEVGSVTGDVNWNCDEATFVSEWAPRIDAYLDGSPLAGYGKTFATAAWKYGVDPRWSPAISNTESSKGLHCFRDHNAWGWGGINFPDWETAIDSHVRGLARGYGNTISVAAAKKYCPPTYMDWYNKTVAEMNKI
ncbi:MAG: hypothetical protein Q4B30_05100 [Coriobacteriaceae bacterium]|nr:hypothetical protein [Coriobacteriaceae bacterium]